MATELLEQAVASTRPVLARVSPEELSAPTPCASWDVRTLINHLISAAYFSVSRVEGAAEPERRTDDFAAGDFLAAYDGATARVIVAFNAPGALEKRLQLPFGELPAAVFLGIVATDQFVHGWDLAVATGQPRQLDPDLACALLERARVALSPEMRGPDGQAPFGPEEPAPANAPPADQLAAFLGRAV